MRLYSVILRRCRRFVRACKAKACFLIDEKLALPPVVKYAHYSTNWPYAKGSHTADSVYEANQSPKIAREMRQLFAEDLRGLLNLMRKAFNVSRDVSSMAETKSALTLSAANLFDLREPRHYLAAPRRHGGIGGLSKRPRFMLSWRYRYISAKNACGAVSARALMISADSLDEFDT